MNAKDIEGIANAVVANLSGGGAEPLGCGSITNAQAYESGPVYACSGGYECGGAAPFSCPEAFTCVHTFDCPESYSRESCSVSFECEGTFGICAFVDLFSPCDLNEVFSPKG